MIQSRLGQLSPHLIRDRRAGVTEYGVNDCNGDLLTGSRLTYHESDGPVHLNCQVNDLCLVGWSGCNSHGDPPDSQSVGKQWHSTALHTRTIPQRQWPKLQTKTYQVPSTCICALAGMVSAVPDTCQALHQACKEQVITTRAS